MRRLLPRAQFMAEPLIEAPGVHRPRNVDWKRAAALLYGDWGTSKAYVIGLAFVAAGFASFPLILAVCALTAVVGFNYIIVCAHFPDGGGVYSAAREQSRFLASRRRAAPGGEFHRHRRAQRLGGSELLRRAAGICAGRDDGARDRGRGDQFLRAETQRQRLDLSGGSGRPDGHRDHRLEQRSSEDRCISSRRTRTTRSPGRNSSASFSR